MCNFTAVEPTTVPFDEHTGFTMSNEFHDPCALYQTGSALPIIAGAVIVISNTVPGHHWTPRTQLVCHYQQGSGSFDLLVH